MCKGTLTSVPLTSLSQYVEGTLNQIKSFGILIYYYRQRGILQEHTVLVFLEHMGFDTHLIWQSVFLFNLEDFILNLGDMAKDHIGC